MDQLPKEILSNIAGYLPPSDATRLNNTCKDLHLKLSLTATSSRQILTGFTRHDRNDDPHCGFHIPVPMRQVLCHSILLSMNWHDQGWGHRKGRVFVVAKNNQTCDRSGQVAEGGNVPSDRNASSERFGGGWVVYSSDIAHHEEQRLEIMLFAPNEQETYHLWYAVGGGGGHILNLSNVRIQALVFDDPSRCFGNAHKALAGTESLATWDDKSMSTAHLDINQFLLSRQGVNLMSSFADSSRDSEADLQLKLMESIRSLWVSWSEECFAYAEIMAAAASRSAFDGRQELRRLQVDDFLEDRMDFGEFVVPEEDF